MLKTDRYLEELKKRARESHVYRNYQLIGLEIAHILGDESHKALYIKLAKERNHELLLTLAKTIAEKKSIRNKGAYFMSCLPKIEKNGKSNSRRKK